MVWIEEAFGEAIGAQNMYWCVFALPVHSRRAHYCRTWITNVLGASIYPVLAGEYIASALSLNAPSQARPR